jgi:hypothetical protein
MNWHYVVIAAVLLGLIPAYSMSDGGSIETGHDLYHSLLLIDNLSDAEDLSSADNAVTFICRFTQGVYLTQDTCPDMILPINISEKEIIEISKLLNINSLNLPNEGVEINKAIRIYQQWAKDNPEKLHDTARMCLFMSYVEAYGFETPTEKP